MVEEKRLAFCVGSGDGLADEVPIVGMDALDVRLEGHVLRLRLETEHPKELVRPADLVLGDVPVPAADVGDLLRLVEAGNGFGDLLDGAHALLQNGTQDQQADGDSSEEPFEDLDDLGVASVGERNRAVDGAGDGDCGDEEASGDCARLPKTQGRPDQDREDQVRVAPVARQEDEGAEAGEHGDENQLPRRGATRGCAGAGSSTRPG